MPRLGPKGGIYRNAVFRGTIKEVSPIKFRRTMIKLCKVAIGILYVNNAASAILRPEL